MGKMEAKRAQKRHAILQAAQQAFLNVGFTEANMDAIAAEAGLTKQTLYRYYPSKSELFRETLKAMATQDHDDASAHLELPDTGQALQSFAVSFMRAHLSEAHLSTFRLLVAESSRAPEMIDVFFSVGPAGTEGRLQAFFRERLEVQDPDPMIRLWMAMLFAYHDNALLGRHHPTEDEIVEHARQATQMLLAGVRSAA